MHSGLITSKGHVKWRVIFNMHNLLLTFAGGVKAVRSIGLFFAIDLFFISGSHIATKCATYIHSSMSSSFFMTNAWAEAFRSIFWGQNPSFRHDNLLRMKLEIRFQFIPAWALLFSWQMLEQKHSGAFSEDKTQVSDMIICSEWNWKLDFNSFLIGMKLCFESSNWLLSKICRGRLSFWIAGCDFGGKNCRLRWRPASSVIIIFLGIYWNAVGKLWDVCVNRKYISCKLCRFSDCPTWNRFRNGNGKYCKCMIEMCLMLFANVLPGAV